MTIFYGGKVVIFDEFLPDKAQAIMQLANNGGTFNNNNPTSSNSTFANKCHQNALKSAPQAKSSDLLIARKASLHRFLEKRNDRIIARAPYKVNGSAGNLAESEVGFSVEKQLAMPESGKQPIQYQPASGGSKPVFGCIDYFWMNSILSQNLDAFGFRIRDLANIVMISEFFHG